jgi:glycosyltransferase involved in cell wall biosynthesis
MIKNRTRARNILFINSLMCWGGGEKWTITCASEMKTRGHRVAVMCQPGAELAQVAAENDLKCYEEKLKPANLVWALLRLAGIVLKGNYHTIVACQTREFLLALLANIVLRRKVVFRRGLNIDIYNGQWLARLSRFSKNCWVFNSQELYRFFQKKYRWLAKINVEVVPHGITLNHEKYSSAEIAQTKAEYGREFGDHSGVTLAFIGRLEPAKGIDLLLEALVGLQRYTELPPWRVLIIGKGEWEGAVRQKFAENTKLPVKYLGFRRDIEKILLYIDAIILPSRRESMPNIMMEAFACQTPAVISKAVGVREVFFKRRHPYPGILIRKLTPEGIAKAIIKFLYLTGPQKKAQGLQGYQIIKDHYQITKIFDTWQALLGEK